MIRCTCPFYKAWALACAGAMAPTLAGCGRAPSAPARPPAAQQEPPDLESLAGEPHWEGVPLSAWVEDLTHGDPQAREYARFALVRIGAPALPHLARALRSEREGTRQEARLGLYLLGRPAVPYLARALRAPRAETRLEAAYALAWLEGTSGGGGVLPADSPARTEAVRALSEGARSRSPEARWKAATGLGILQPGGGEESPPR